MSAQINIALDIAFDSEIFIAGDITLDLDGRSNRSLFVTGSGITGGGISGISMDSCGAGVLCLLLLCLSNIAINGYLYDPAGAIIGATPGC